MNGLLFSWRVVRFSNVFVFGCTEWAKENEWRNKATLTNSYDGEDYKQQQQQQRKSLGFYGFWLFQWPPVCVSIFLLFLLYACVCAMIFIIIIRLYKCKLEWVRGINKKEWKNKTKQNKT